MRVRHKQTYESFQYTGENAKEISVNSGYPHYKESNGNLYLFSIDPKENWEHIEKQELNYVPCYRSYLCYPDGPKLYYHLLSKGDYLLVSKLTNSVETANLSPEAFEELFEICQEK